VQHPIHLTARWIPFIAVGVLALSYGVAPAEPIRFNAADLPPRSLPEAVAQRPVPEWLRTNLRIGHLPPGLGRMPEAYLAAGYNVLTINALRKWDIVGPSAALYDPVEVKAADDTMRRYVQMVHKAGAKAVFYIGPVQTPAFSPEFVKAHPDWLKINPDGKPDAAPNFVNIRSGQVDWLLKQMAYVTREYGADGFWLDGYAPAHLHTYDKATRDAFAAFSGGKDIPVAVKKQGPARFDVVHDPVARQYLAWHEAYFVELADRMRGAIRAENPNAVIFANHSGNRTWYYPDAYMGEYPLRYCSAVDVSSVELYWDVPGDALYQPFVYAFMQALTRDRGATVWIQPSEYGISGVSSPVEIQLRGLEGPPWGVYSEFVESTGREEYLKLHVENVKAREKWEIGSEPLSYVGVLASDQTRALHGNAALPSYVSHALGAFRSLMEAHWPVRLLTEMDLEDADLRGVRVLVLPNTACLSDRSVEVVRRFVHAGGGLVAGNDSSLYGDDFQRRKDFALGDLFRARYIGAIPVASRTEGLQLSLEKGNSIVDDALIRSRESTAWRNPEGAPPDRGPLALIASASEVEALDGGAIPATFQVSDPKRAGKQFPALITSSYGKGRVVYFAAGIDKAMFFYPDGALRRIFLNACRWAADGVPPPVEVEGPLILITTFRRQPKEGRTVVHLLNSASSWGQHSIYQKIAPLPEELRKEFGYPDSPELRGTWPIREEVIPLRDVRVTCRVPGVKKATLQPGNLDLPLRRVDDGVEVVVPKIEMHSMVVFE
jgi:Trehalose utilisation